MNSFARLPHAPSMGLGAAVEAFLHDRDLADSTRRVYELTLAALASDLGADIEVASITGTTSGPFSVLATTRPRRRPGTGW